MLALVLSVWTGLTAKWMVGNIEPSEQWITRRFVFPASAVVSEFAFGLRAPRSREKAWFDEISLGLPLDVEALVKTVQGKGRPYRRLSSRGLVHSMSASSWGACGLAGPRRTSATPPRAESQAPRGRAPRLRRHDHRPAGDRTMTVGMPAASNFATRSSSL